MSAIKDILCGGEVSTVTTTVTVTEITTDDIEAMIEEQLKLPDTACVDFDWHAGQWPSLTVTVTDRVGGV
jgi:hypothetical protein